MTKTNNYNHPLTPLIAESDPSAIEDSLIEINPEPQNKKRARKATAAFGIVMASMAGDVANSGPDYNPLEGYENNMELPIDSTSTVAVDTPKIVSKGGGKITAEEILRPDAAPYIDCSSFNFEIPDKLDAVVAKKTVSNIEFFIDDPDQLEQIKEALHESETYEEAEQILEAIFSPRGIAIHFNEVPFGVQFTPERPDLDLYKQQLTNLVEAYSFLPKKIAEMEKNLFIANQVILPSDINGDGVLQPKELQAVSGIQSWNGITFSIDTLSTSEWSKTVVWHELFHKLDDEMCAVDPAYKQLRDANPYTAIDTGYDTEEREKILSGDPSKLRELLKVVGHVYGLTNILEDKATAFESVALGNYPDTTDEDYSPDDLLTRKKELLVGRASRYLDAPLDQLFIFNDLFGTTVHPKIIADSDILPSQREFFESVSSASWRAGITPKQFLDQMGRVRIKLPDGSEEVLLYSTTINNGKKIHSISATLNFPRPNNFEGSCEDIPDVQKVLEGFKDAIKSLGNGQGVVGGSVYNPDTSNDGFKCAIAAFDMAFPESNDKRKGGG